MSNEMTPRPTPDPQVMRQLGRESSWRLPKRAWFGGAGALGLAVIVAIFFWLRGDGPSYVTQEAVRGDLEVVVSATGTLRPRDQVDIGAEISGRIEKVLVDFNDRVVTGQILALLNTDQLEAKLAQSQAQFVSARANVAQQEATLAQARATAARAEELFERSVLSQQELEAAQADLQRANANLRRANADAQLAAALVTADETNLSKASILSPIDGVVLDRRVEPGQAVAASFQTPILFTLASDLSQMELQIDLDEADIGVVHEGQHASFTVDAFPQRRFDADLVALHNAPETVNGVVTFPGVLAVDNNQRILRPGLTATVIILVADIKDALLVPNGALRFTPDDEIASQAPPLPDSENAERIGRVWVLEGSRPVPRDLSVGRTDGRFTEVLSGDLAPGMRVITDVENTARRPARGPG